MQKKFLSNLALLLALNLLIKTYWVLGIDTQVQKSVGTADYGLYFALFNFSFLLNILLDVGITNFNNKNIAQNNHLLTKHFSSLTVLKFLLAVVYILVTAVCGWVIGYDERLMRLLLWLGFNQFLISLIMYLRSNLAGLHLFRTDAVISVLDRSIMILLCLGLLYGGWVEEMDIMYYVYAQTAGYILTAAVTFFIVVSKTHSLRLKWSLPFSVMILKKSFPFAVLVLLMTFYNRIDTVMLERMLPEGKGAYESGIYAQGYRFLDATNMIAFLFSGLLLPIFSRMIKYKESVEQLVKLSFTILITPALVIGAGCFFYQADIMEAIYGKVHVREAEPVFATLMACFIPISTTYIFGTLLTANGNLRQMNIMAATGMGVNITLNLLLIPSLSSYGSALASLITQSLSALAQVLIVQRFFRFQVNKRLLGTLVVYAAGVVGINYFSKMIHPDWRVNFCTMLVSCVLWAFLTGLITIKGIFRVIKYG
ncbi:MAG: oligosaccharide flippase family protein [Bacteroidia bacterium]|nr:oligosaccharide flippase family protein [Bacteroidia bacterium]